MSNLTRQQCLELGEEHFALPEHKSCPIFDYEDVVKAVHRAPFAKDPETMRLRICEIAMKKGLRIPPTLAFEKLRLLAAQTVREGLAGTPAQGNTLRAVVSSEAEIDAACELAKTKLKEKAMSTNFQNRHDTPEGRNALQQIHDVAARYGAICTAQGKLSADFIAKHESTKLQQVHDLCAAGGAKCRAVGDSVFAEGDESGLGDPRELVKSHVARRNEGRPVTSRSATGEVSEAVKAHVSKRNAQIRTQKERTRKIESDGSHHWGR